MAEATLGWCSTQASANCDNVQPACWASGFSFCTAPRMAGVSQDWMGWPIGSRLGPGVAGVGQGGWACPVVRWRGREPVGRAAPGTYWPDSTPCASGDQTIWEIPFAAQRGMTASSGLRQSSEYCGWLETKRSLPATANAASICCGDHSLKPM